MRDKYEDSILLQDIVEPNFQPREKGDQGRFCFGVMGDVVEPMCTMFKFAPHVEYQLDGRFSRSSQEAVLFVNGTLEASEPRELERFGNGTVALQVGCCESLEKRKFSGKTQISKILNGTSLHRSNNSQLQAGSNEQTIWAHQNEIVSTSQCDGTVELDTDFVWLHARVIPSSEDGNKHHIILSVTDNAHCTDPFLALSWSRRRFELDTDAERYATSSNDVLASHSKALEKATEDVRRYARPISA